MHTMTLIKEHQGTEEWMCYSCGRHLLVSWDPDFRKTVLAEGDPSAQHTRLKKTSQSGAKKDAPTALLPKPAVAPVDPMDDPRLIPWLNWMEESGFENLWNADYR